MKSLLVVFSYHHNNTIKIACEFAKVLDAQIIPLMVDNPGDISEYDLIGFGSEKKLSLKARICLYQPSLKKRYQSGDPEDQ